jgi:hypothetical protein
MRVRKNSDMANYTLPAGEAKRQRSAGTVLRLMGIKKATVLTLMTICFNGSLRQTRSFDHYRKMRPLVRALLDAGIRVDTHWAHIDYTILDKRLPKGTE